MPFLVFSRIFKALIKRIKQISETGPRLTYINFASSSLNGFLARY